MVVAKEHLLSYGLNLQATDAQTTNLTGRQHMPSQVISKHLLFPDNANSDLNGKYIKWDLIKLVDELDVNIFLKATNKVSYARLMSHFERIAPLTITF